MSQPSGMARWRCRLVPLGWLLAFAAVSQRRNFAIPSRVAARSFYGDSIPMPPPGHPDYPAGVGNVQPFANQNGGVDDTIAPPRIYMYGPSSNPLAGRYAVDCAAWNDADGARKAEMVEKVLAVLNKNGFVVLENMVPPEAQLQMEAAATQLSSRAFAGTFGVLRFLQIGDQLGAGLLVSLATLPKTEDTNAMSCLIVSQNHTVPPGASEAIEHFQQMPSGYFTSPLRADRSQATLS